MRGSLRQRTLSLLTLALLGTLVQAQRSDSQLRQARALFEARKFNDAAAAAQAAIRSNPDNVDGWKIAGLSLQLAERIPESLDVFEEAVRRFPSNPDLWFYIARVRYVNHELTRSEKAARRALELEPAYADAHTQLGLIHEEGHRYEEALASYKAAIELGRKKGRPDSMPLVRSGELLLKLDRPDKAVQDLTAALLAKGDSGRVHLLLGQAFERLGRSSEAETEYRRALKLGESNARTPLDRLRAGLPSLLGERKVLTSDTLPLIRWRESAAAAGLRFVLRNSASPNKYQIETMTGGVAVLDYDGDGWLDVFFVNGAELPSLEKRSPEHWNRLFHNNQDGTFTDVTEKAGVRGEGYSMGAAVGDYDNDGHADLFVAGVNRNILFHNNGDGTFADITARAGVEGIDATRGKMWSVAAAWLDYDNDGDLDLFVVNYTKWSPGIDPYCGALTPGMRTYCFPDRYEGLPSQLFRNNGDGAFTDVSEASGIGAHIGKGMGVAVADFDDDGLIDVFVANDTVPNFLFRNTGRGRFEEVAFQAGVAALESGRPVSGMGVDFRDFDNDGRPDLIVSALEGETFPVFRNLGKRFFVDATYPSGFGLLSVRRSGWSIGLFDFNNDGWKDLFAANAHVNDNIELYSEQKYRQSNAAFVNIGNGSFRDVSREAGLESRAPAAHRGAAFGDFNNDGRIDVVTTALNEPAELWMNESAADSHWLLVRLIGTRSNRDGIGARLSVVTPSGRRQFNHATTSVGYASSSDVRVHFGLGGEDRVAEIEIRWPSGTVQTLRDVPADGIVIVTEGKQR